MQKLIITVILALAMATGLSTGVLADDPNTDVDLEADVIANEGGGGGGGGLPPVGDSTPPFIYNVQHINITTNSATITWSTSEIATGQVVYRGCSAMTSPSTEWVYTETYTALVLEHSIVLSNLLPNTPYCYYVTSKDKADNEGNSEEYSFSTIPMKTILPQTTPYYPTYTPPRQSGSTDRQGSTTPTQPVTPSTPTIPEAPLEAPDWLIWLVVILGGGLLLLLYLLMRGKRVEEAGMVPPPVARKRKGKKSKGNKYMNAIKRFLRRVKT